MYIFLSLTEILEASRSLISAWQSSKMSENVHSMTSRIGISNAEHI